METCSNVAVATGDVSEKDLEFRRKPAGDVTMTVQKLQLLDKPKLKKRRSYKLWVWSLA